MEAKYKNKTLVRITEPGQLYSAYAPIAEKMCFTEWKETKTAQEYPKIDDICVVINSVKHLSDSVIVYALKRLSDGQPLLMGEAGITDEDIDLKKVFTVGQRIRLHRGWSKQMDGDCYDHSEMAQKWSGKVVTVKTIYNTDFTVYENSNSFFWSPEMVDFFADTEDVKTVVDKPQDFKDLKPGTKVRLKSDLVPNKMYGIYRFTHFMKAQGLLRTIEGSSISGKGYYVTEPRDSNAYTPEMIDSVVEEDAVATIPDTMFEPGDKVRVRMDLVEGKTYGKHGWRTYYEYTMGRKGEILTFKKYEEGGEPALHVKELNRGSYALGMLEFVERPAKGVEIQNPTDSALLCRLSVGTTVSIANPLSGYSACDGRAKELGATKFVKNALCIIGDSGVIVNYRFVGSQHFFLFRRDDGQEFLMGPNGFKTFEPKQSDTYVPFKAGERVMINPELIFDKRYGIDKSILFVTMGNPGDIRTIRKVEECSLEREGFRYYVEGCQYQYSPDMLVSLDAHCVEYPRNPLHDDAISAEKYHSEIAESIILEVEFKPTMHLAAATLLKLI